MLILFYYWFLLLYKKPSGDFCIYFVPAIVFEDDYLVAKTISLNFTVSVVLQIGINHANSSGNPTGIRMPMSKDSYINHVFYFLHFTMLRHLEALLTQERRPLPGWLISRDSSLLPCKHIFQIQTNQSKTQAPNHLLYWGLILLVTSPCANRSVARYETLRTARHPRAQWSCSNQSILSLLNLPTRDPKPTWVWTQICAPVTKSHRTSSHCDVWVSFSAPATILSPWYQHPRLRLESKMQKERRKDGVPFH